MTAHESIASGADIIAFKDSGNVATLIQNTGHGFIVENYNELNELFNGDNLIKRAYKIRSSGRQLYNMIWSSLTADFIDSKLTQNNVIKIVN